LKDFADGGHRVDKEGIFPHTAISEQKRLLSRLVHDTAKDEDKQSTVQESEPDGDESKRPQDQASQCLSSSVDRIGGKRQEGSGIGIQSLGAREATAVQGVDEEAAEVQ